MMEVIRKDNDDTATTGRRVYVQVVTGRAKGNGTRRGKGCGASGAPMRRMWSLDAKSRAEDRYGESIHNPLGAVGRVPGDGRGGSSGTRRPRPSQWMNEWSGFRPQGPTFTVTSRLSAWTKLGGGPGNLRDVRSLVVEDQGSRGCRRCEWRERPTEWQVRGSPGDTSTVLSSVSGDGVFNPGTKVDDEVREQRQRRSRKGLQGLSEGAAAVREGASQDAIIGQDPSAIRRTSDSSPN